MVQLLTDVKVFHLTFYTKLAPIYSKVRGCVDASLITYVGHKCDCINCLRKHVINISKAKLKIEVAGDLS
jgi:hypothetical protein